MKLFAVAFYASGRMADGIKTGHTARCVVAEDEKTAKCIGLDACKKVFPLEEGFADWQVSLSEINMGLYKVGEQIYKLSLREVQPENEDA